MRSSQALPFWKSGWGAHYGSLFSHPLQDVRVGVHTMAVWFGTLSRMSGFLWHSSKWARRVRCFLQYSSRLEVLACSLNTDLNYVTTMLNYALPWTTKKVAVTLKGKMWQLFQCILKDRYIAPATLWGLNQRPSTEFPAKCINSLDEIPSIPSWFSFGLGLFVLPLYIWLTCYLLDS